MVFVTRVCVPLRLIIEVHAFDFGTVLTVGLLDDSLVGQDHAVVDVAVLEVLGDIADFGGSCD